MKTLCRWCNNSIKTENEYICCGGKDIIKFEKQARQAKKDLQISIYALPRYK